MTQDIEASVDVLRVAIGKFPLEADVRVTREISAAAWGLPSSESAPLVVGRLFIEARFLLMSMNGQPPRSTGRVDPLDLELLVPAGTPALAIGQLSEYPLERELRSVSLSAQQATELRRYASRNGRPMPISQHECDLYATDGREPPAV